jgi:hypothetical protein
MNVTIDYYAGGLLRGRGIGIIHEVVLVVH